MHVEESRGLIADQQMIANAFAYFVQHAFMGTASCFFHAASHGTTALRRERRFGHTLKRDTFVPEFERTALPILKHAIAVFAHRGHHEIAGDAATQAHVSGSHHEARREALEIPLERPERCFVEIVQVKHELPFWRREAAKIHQVTISADRHHKAGVRYAAQIVSLEDRAAAKKGKRRYRHAAIAQRHQLLDPPFAALLEQIDRTAMQFSQHAVTGPL